MLSLYAPEATQLTRLRTMLPVSVRSAATSDWSEFERSIPDAACGIVAVADVDCGTVRQLAGLTRRYPLVPIVVVTQKDADNVRRLSGIKLHAVIWPTELPHSLRSAVERALSTTGLTALAASLGEAVDLPVRLRSALARACVSEPPLRSVADLAITAKLDRRTLWRHWHRACGPALPVRLEDFLHWILLLHAVSLKSSGKNWLQVASELRVHEHTLQRLARRLGGMTCGELVSLGSTALAARFTQEVVHPLLERRQERHSGANRDIPLLPADTRRTDVHRSLVPPPNRSVLMKQQATSFSPKRLDALISKINSDPALLEQDWRDLVRSHFPLLPDEERTLAQLSPEKVKHIQDYLSEAAVRHKKGGKFTGRLVERGPHERADGLVYDIEVDVLPAPRGNHPKA